MFQEIFKNFRYPLLLNTIDALKLSALPPWEFLYDNYDVWKSDFNKVSLFDYVPFARMVNDDVIATFNIKTQSEEVYLFILPIFPTSKPFKTLGNIDVWLKLALEDCYEYITEY